MVFGLVAENIAAHAADLDAARVFLATFCLLVPALVGARLLFVAIHWGTYRREPGRIWRRGEGGAAMYGSVPCMMAAAVPLLPALSLPFGGFWDVATFGILVGMPFTRVGCLLNGCCAGRIRRIPSQLLEAGWAIVLLVAAMYTWRLLPFPGALFLAVLAAYGSGRVVLQTTRENREMLGPVDLQQVISVAFVMLAFACLVLLRP